MVKKIVRSKEEIEYGTKELIHGILMGVIIGFILGMLLMK
tara:strand:- start:670 stop:789 length:120 start_codon:yes stop_codon:yes gene_type:complete